MIWRVILQFNKDCRQTAMQGMSFKSWQVTEGPSHGLERALGFIYRRGMLREADWRKIVREKWILEGHREKKARVLVVAGLLCLGASSLV